MENPKKVWCVRYLDRSEPAGTTTVFGWCATKTQPKTCPRYKNNQPTACAHFVILPTGYEQREPTCPACRKKLGLDCSQKEQENAG